MKILADRMPNPIYIMGVKNPYVYVRAFRKYDCVTANVTWFQHLTKVSVYIVGYTNFAAYFHRSPTDH
jgi:hypothetical protein